MSETLPRNAQSVAEGSVGELGIFPITAMASVARVDCGEHDHPQARCVQQDINN